MNKIDVPKLGTHCGDWYVTRKIDDSMVCKLRTYRNVSEHLRIESSLQYLQRVNRK